MAHVEEPLSSAQVSEESPELHEVGETVAAGVARVREDEKHFGKDVPAKQDELCQPGVLHR